MSARLVRGLILRNAGQAGRAGHADEVEFFAEEAKETRLFSLKSQGSSTCTEGPTSSTGRAQRSGNYTVDVPDSRLTLPVEAAMAVGLDVFQNR